MHCKWKKKWCSVILSWVNSFQEDFESFLSLSCVKYSVFLSSLIIKIYESEKREVPCFKNIDELSNTFIKDYFPECMPGDLPNLESEENNLIILSLIMYSVCIKCKISDICNRNCNFIDSTNQIVLTRFFEKMIEIGDGRFTKLNLYEAIRFIFGSFIC
ncbi:hypothetical protein J6590_075633 [Homalodisca vitripennis]|nr:hypothetical protein J6590_075633 [Homalodisca vitripennis]